jgi:hypothetical protein
MVSGGDIDLIKARRIGPESLQHAEGFVAKLDKDFMDRANRRRRSRGNKVKKV